MRRLDRLGLELTTRCNRRCAHCFRDETGTAVDLDADLALRIMSEAASLGVERVALTGGEPALYGELEAVVAGGKERGLQVELVTNGYRFAEVYERLAAAGHPPDHVQFSLDGADEGTHDAVRGAGSFREVMRGVSVCHARGAPFALLMVVNRKNRAEMGTLALLGAALGARQVLFAFMQPTPAGVAAGLLPDPDETRRIRAEAARLTEAFKSSVSLTIGLAHPDAILGCRSLELADLNVDAKGRLTLCCQLSGHVGASAEGDVVADLSTTSLVDAAAKALRQIGALRACRVRERLAGRADPRDEFFCYYCLRTFHKLDWLKDCPGQPWTPASVETQGE